MGTYPEILRLFSNHVLATDLSIVELSKAVRAGRTFVVFDFLGDGTGFYMSYGKKGAPVDERAILGDTTPFEKENTLDISLPGTSFQGSLLRVVRDGKTLSETASGRLAMTLPGPGVLRAEVYREKRLWIVSSPIYVTP